MTVFIRGNPRFRYQVVMRDASGKWSQASSRFNYREAETDAKLLVRSGQATECHIHELKRDGARIIARVTKGENSAVKVEKL
jgi:hypothetical protein